MQKIFQHKFDLKKCLKKFIILLSHTSCSRGAVKLKNSSGNLKIHGRVSQSLDYHFHQSGFHADCMMSLIEKENFFISKYLIKEACVLIGQLRKMF